MITVLVTGGGGQVAQSVIKCLRLAFDYRIVITDIDPLLAGIYRGDVGYLISKGWGSYAQEMNAICKKESVDIIIPCSDVELDYIVDNVSNFNTPILMADPKTVKLCRDKWLTAKTLREYGFNAPLTYSFEEYEGMEYPEGDYILKPKLGFGTRHFYHPHDAEELCALANYMEKEGYEPVVQEYLEGAEYSGMVLIATDGEILSVTLAKSEKRFGMSYKTIHLTELEDRPIHELMYHIAKKLEAVGPLSVQMRMHNGEPYVQEMNARFTGAQIIRAVLGVNGPDILVKNWLTGEKQYPQIKRRAVALWYADYMYVTTEDVRDLNIKRKTLKKGDVLKLL